MKIYPIDYLIQYARENSHYYRNLYKSLPSNTSNLRELPFIDQDQFWSSNTIKNNALLTSLTQEGIVFKSGGTSGKPKFSYFTKEEWMTFTSLFGQAMIKGGLSANSKVANLFFVGDLYASFIFIMDSLNNCNTPILQFPIAGQTSFEAIYNNLKEFKIDTIAAVPTHLIGLICYMKKEKLDLPNLKKILYGGESLYPDQAKLILEYNPSLQIQSIGIASVDAGLLGYAMEDCAFDEHYCFDQSTVLEIIDEHTGDVITDLNKPGKMFITNLTRLLMPIIRYPAGDRAQWVAKNKFKVLGRSDEAARLGPVSLYFDDIRNIISKNILFHCFQLKIVHQDLKDHLIIKIVADQEVNDRLKNDLIEEIYEQRKSLKESVEQKLIHPIEINFVNQDDLEVNSRTGKAKRIIDLRK